MLAAASISLLAMAPSADAAVTWLVSEVGGSVHATTTGSLVVLPGGYATGGFNGAGAGPNTFGYWNGGTPDTGQHYAGTGLGTGYVLPMIPYATSLVSGELFFLDGDRLYYQWSKSGLGTITPNSVIDLGPGTIASFFGTNLDSGPRTIWMSASGDTISIAAVIH